MGILDTARDVERERVWLIAYALVPYLDQETIGILPGVRDVAPYIENIYLTEREPTELLRLAGLIVIPYVDGEVIRLLLGVDIMDVINNSGDDPILRGLGWVWSGVTGLYDRLAIWR